MSAAIPDDGRAPTGTSISRFSDSQPPPDTQTGDLFDGLPMVGSFFYLVTTPGQPTQLTGEFCTGSVVASPGHNLVLTAGHCAKSLQTAVHRVFVPQFRNGQPVTSQPHGVFPIVNASHDVFVDPRYIKNSKSAVSDLDFAFVRLGTEMVAGAKQGKQIQDLTGSLTPTTTPSYYNGGVLVVGYPEDKGFNPQHRAVRCTVPTSKLTGFNQMLMYCHGYYGGVSGGPWILNYNETTHTGQVIGNVGGYNGGGDDLNHDWVTYSPMYNMYNYEIKALYDDAVANRTPARSGDYQTPQAARDDALPDAATWKAYSRFVVAGDFLGHGVGITDLLVIWQDGEVDIYPSKGNGHFGAEIRVHNSNSEWTNVAAVTAGDFIGGTESDLLVRWGGGTDTNGKVSVFPDVGDNGLPDGTATQLAAPGSIWRDAIQVTGGRFTDDTPYVTDLEVRWVDGEVSLYHHVGTTFGTETQLMPPNNAWTAAAGMTSGTFNGSPHYDTMVRWTDGSLDVITGPSPDTKFGPTTRLEQPGSIWQDATLITTGNFTNNGQTNDVFVRWIDGEVDIYPGTTTQGLGPEMRLVSP